MKRLTLWLAATAITATAWAGDYEAVRDFIAAQMPLSVRSTPTDTLGKLGLPHPYSVPCVRGMFQDMFYWDTYYTNLGLLAIGDTVQARNNVDNILYVIDGLGYMPNATERGMFNRSQPPYASMMVDDIYRATADTAWLAAALPVLESEYDFWMTRRIAPNGLNRHGNSATPDELRDFYGYMTTRFPHLPADAPDSTRIAAGSHFLSEAESGWDFSPRFDSRCEDFNPVDLNANLYLYERNFERYYRDLGLDGADRWGEAAERRRRLMEATMRDPATGLYFDYDYRAGRRSDVYSAAVFNLLWAGVLSGPDAAAAVAALPRLEMECGVVGCEMAERPYVYQWDSPNAWASFNVLAVAGLDRYGYSADALRIARKYADSIAAIYRSTGNLWEKYNGVTGTIDVKSEYELPPFMGWTAGAFMYMTDYLR